MTIPFISAIAIDLGTTSIKAGVLDRHGTLHDVVSHPAPKITVESGRYESDALGYALAAEHVLNECMAHAGECRTLGLCSQRSSFLIWNRVSGQPVSPLISWQDDRGKSVCEALHMHKETIRALTGLPLTQYYFAPKLRKVLQDKSGWREKLEQGELLAGTLDTFLVWRWSGGRHFVTDASMAARTQLMDIRQQQWSQTLCDLLGIPIAILPQIMPSAGMNLKLDSGLVLQACVADQSAALFASMGSGVEALANLGTGGFVVRYLAEGIAAPDGYLHTLVYQDQMHRVHFASEGTLNSIAAALGPYPVDTCRLEDLAQNDILCLAEPSGLGAPYFRNDIGLKFSEPVDHLPRSRIAVLLMEAVIFRVARILEDFHDQSSIERVYLSGGLSGLNCLQHGIAQCVPFDVHHLTQSEASLQGAALLAAGMPAASSRASTRIAATGDAHVLQQKYLRWKTWFDGLLDGR